VKKAFIIRSYFDIPFRGMKAKVKYHRLSMTTVENLVLGTFSATC